MKEAINGSYFCHVRKQLSRRVKDERNILCKKIKRKANWIGRVLRRKCLIKHVIKGNIEKREGWE